MPFVNWPGRISSLGASPTKAMSHIAIQEDVNGEVVTWLEKVSDQE